MNFNVSNAQCGIRRKRPLQRCQWVSLICLASALVSPARAGFVYENAWELQSDGDFDGDGRRDLIIVDKATGTYRIGYQLSPGVYTWVLPRASGIAGATGLGIGKINSQSYDSLALTGPDANRVNLIDATNTSIPGLPISVFLPSLGPNVAAVIDIGGPTNTVLDDLYVASLYNGIPAWRETLIRNNGGTNQTLLADNSILYLRERANPVLLHTNRPTRLGLFERGTGPTNDMFSVFDMSGGAALKLTSATVSRAPQPFEYVTGQFAAANPYTEFLLYPPTGWYFYDYQVIEPVPGTYSLAYSNIYYFSNYVDRILSLPGTNGTRLLVFDVSDTSATIYTFDGQSPPSFMQQFNAAPGEHFTGAAILGNGGFMAYSAPSGQNTTARFAQWTWTGSAYSNNASGNLPPVSGYSASGNVMQFQFEPFVTNNPILLRLNNAGDWASGPTLSGGNISVKTETFLSSTQGLANPTPILVGPAHPLAAFGLANQYTNMISLFSFTPPAGDKTSDVTISPSPGLYSVTIQLQFTAANPSDHIYFRFGNGAWTAWSGGMLVQLFTNTQVQYYGQPNAGNGKSIVKTANYTFTQGPSTLDSKGDGIPDYVKIALGLKLTGSGDSDGDGYSDLEELIHGFNPLDPASVPTNYPHLDDQAVFDLSVTPKPWDGFSNVMTLCATNTLLHAYDLQGSLRSEGLVDTNTWPVAVLSNIIIVADDRLVVDATDPHYDILAASSDTRVGREMVGMVAVPPLQRPTVSYAFGGGNITNEAHNWIAAASNTFNHLPRAVLTNTLTPNSTLEALLFELETARLLGTRGNSWASNLTLFPFRPSDAGRVNPLPSTLLSLETATTNQPGYKLQALFGTISNLVESSNDPGISNLCSVVRDIYRMDSLLNNSNPARFVSPVDEVRYFLWNGTMDTNYLAFATTSGQFSSAIGGANLILATAGPRPVTNVTLVVRADTLGGPCRILDLLAGGATFALQDSFGQPFGFPQNFQLLTGTVVQVSGYTDATNPACAWPAIEVTDVLLASMPVATDRDADGNLLLDSWEQRFFGNLGVANPFADSDGDGYSNLQEMLEGSDPLDFYGRPSVPPVTFSPPVLALKPNGGQIELHYFWPAVYINRFNFGVRHSSNLGQPFTDLPVSPPVPVGGDEFKITFSVPATEQHYYYLSLSLR
jgi:hypothetical protein